MKKAFLQIVVVICSFSLFQVQFSFGQKRLTFRKGRIPTAPAAELKQIQQKAELQIQGDLSGKKIVSNPQMKWELQKVANLLLKLAPVEFAQLPVKLIIINDINFGARAYANGVIVIDQNVICTRSDQMIVYVIGHELAHIGFRDSLSENIFKDNLRNELAEFLRADPSPAEVTKKIQADSNRLQNLYFLQEVENDIWGIRSMVAAGFRFSDDTELVNFYIDDPLYPKKQERAKLVLDEQNSFLRMCNLCPKKPMLNLSRLRLGCFGSRK